MLGGDRKDDVTPRSGRFSGPEPESMDDDVAVLRDAYEALNHGDIECALAVLDENAEWTEHSDIPEAGTYRGRNAIRAFLQSFLESWQEFDQEIEDMITGEGRVLIMLCSRVRGRGSGINVEAAYAHLWTMEGGRAVRVDAYFDRDQGLRALRASARQH
jgi:ketosteroid isomerase-like protein